MTTATMPFFRLPALADILGRRTSSPEALAPSDDAELSRRAFISEKLAEYPDAVSSEYGMASLMAQFPGEF